MPERLLNAVNELTKVVRSLERTLKEDYPRRDEINRRRRQMIVATVLAIIASYFFTVGTISGCFLGEGARSGNAPRICNWLPGYNDAQEHNKIILHQFEKLVNETQANHRRIARLEHKRNH